MDNFITAKAIYAHLDKYIFGQKEAKKLVSSLLFVHYSQMLMNMSSEERIKTNSNLLLLGPTGFGKTYIISTACKFMKLPFISISAKALTNTGYVGSTLEELIGDRYFKDFSTDPLRDYCIIYIDEIDKICTVDSSRTEGWLQSLQASLLKIVEGDEVSYAPRDAKDVKVIKAQDFTFVFSGRFEHIEKLRDKPDKNIGFHSTKPNSSATNSVKMLEKCGMISELIGRIGSVGEVEKFDYKGFYDILKNKEGNELQTYIRFFKAFGIDIKITDSVLRTISKKAQSLGIGVRGLNSVLADYFRDKLFNLDETDLKNASFKTTTADDENLALVFNKPAPSDTLNTIPPDYTFITYPLDDDEDK